MNEKSQKSRIGTNLTVTPMSKEEANRRKTMNRNISKLPEPDKVKNEADGKVGTKDEELKAEMNEKPGEINILSLYILIMERNKANTAS